MAAEFHFVADLTEQSWKTSIIRESGTDIRAVQDLLGHATVEPRGAI